MRRKKGAVNLWLAICLLPVLAVALLALMDYLRYQQYQGRLEQVSRYASEWGSYSSQGDLYEKYGIRSVLVDQSQAAIADALGTQFSEDEHYFAEYAQLKLVKVEGTLADPRFIKEAILQKQHFAFAVAGIKKIVDTLALVDHFKATIAALSKTLKIIELVDQSTREIQNLEAQYEQLSAGFPTDLPSELANLAASITQLNRQGQELSEALSTLERILNDSKTTEPERLKVRQQRSELLRAIEDLQDTFKKWRTTLIAYRNLADEIEAVIKQTTALVTTLNALSEQMDAEALVDKLGEGTFKEALQPMATIWQKCGKSIALANKALTALRPKAQRWLTTFKADVDLLITLSDPLVYAQGDGELFQPVLQTVAELPTWPTLEFSDLLREFVTEGVQLKNPEGFKKWLKAQSLKTITDISRLYGSDIPEERYIGLPSQQGTQAGSVSQSRFDASKVRGFSGIIEAASLWEALNEMVRGAGVSLTERAVINHYVLDYFSYNVPSDFEKDRVLGEVEYLLIGNRYGLVNAAGTDAQIGLLRVGLNAVALLVTKQQTVQYLATQLAAVTGGISYPVAYGVVLGGWAIAESASDLYTLHRGDSVSLCKLDGDFTIDVESELIGIPDPGKQAVISKALEQLAIKWQYEDYLSLLLFIVPEEHLLLRIADQWQLASDFPLSNHVTQLHLEATVPFRGAIFRGGVVRCPIIYQVYKGVIAD